MVHCSCLSIVSITRPTAALEPGLEPEPPSGIAEETLGVGAAAAALQGTALDFMEDRWEPELEPPPLIQSALPALSSRKEFGRSALDVSLMELSVLPTTSNGGRQTISEPYLNHI